MTTCMRAGLVALFAAIVSSSDGVPAATPTPVLVELFTSEGCSSCPPADQLLARMVEATAAGGALVVALGEHVDYWDDLGWRDRFSSPAFTARQQQYARRLDANGPYTPQLVIDGREAFVGSDAAAARRAIATAAARPHGTMTIDIRGAAGAGGRASIRALNLPQRPDQHADVFLAVTEDRLRSEVARGENRGRTLLHTAVVRRLVVVGEAIGQAASIETGVEIAAGWDPGALHVVTFVQERKTGVVLAAASAVVPNR